MASQKPTAGLTTAMYSKVQGLTMEPPILRKKRIAPPTVPSASEYILLGNTEKFSSNVPYRDSKKHLPDPATKVSEEKAEFDLQPVRCTKKAEPPKPVALPVTRFNPGSPIKKNRAPSPKKVKKSDSPKKRQATKPAAPATADSTVSTAQTAVNEANKASQTTDADPQQNDTADKENRSKVDQATEYVMRYRAGVARRSPKRRSEYQKMFVWRNPEKQTPLLAANQIVYNSNPQVAPHAVGSKLSATTEYRNQFVPWSLSHTTIGGEPSSNNNNNNNNEVTSGPSNTDNSEGKMLKGKHRRSKSEASVPRNISRAAGLPSQRQPSLSKESDSHTPAIQRSSEEPTRPSTRHWTSEYRSNFQPYTELSYDHGVWKRAQEQEKASDQPTKPQGKPEQSVDGSVNWFSEVCELRQKAAEYRRRAQGQHFSREHVGQLLAKQAALWDSTSDSVSEGVPDTNGSTAAPQSSDQGSAVSELTSAVPQAPTASRVVAPSRVVTGDPGAHRLAWMSDAGRTASPSDSVRSIQSESVDDHTVSDQAGGEEASGETAAGSAQASGEAALGNEDSRTPSYTHTAESLDRLQVIGVGIKPLSSDECDCETKPVATNTELGRGFVSPTYGSPTKDSHQMEDSAKAAVDTVVRTNRRRSPATGKPKLATLAEGAGQTYKVPLPQQGHWSKLMAQRKDDERSDLSASLLSVASSCSSLASETLERANQRRNNFWNARK